jgi:hypothetical protein
MLLAPTVTTGAAGGAAKANDDNADAARLTTMMENFMEFLSGPVPGFLDGTV